MKQLGAFFVCAMIAGVIATMPDKGTSSAPVCPTVATTSGR